MLHDHDMIHAPYPLLVLSMLLNAGAGCISALGVLLTATGRVDLLPLWLGVLLIAARGFAESVGCMYRHGKEPPRPAPGS